MKVNGLFDVSLTAQKDRIPAGRFLLDKKYHGELNAVGLGQMLSKRSEKGTSVYVALEEVSGTLLGKSGSFMLLHKGVMSANDVCLEVNVVSGSGTEDLAGLEGKMNIINDCGQHRYEFDFIIR